MRWFEVFGNTALATYPCCLHLFLRECKSDFRSSKALMAHKILFRENNVRRTMEKAGTWICYTPVNLPTFAELGRMSVNETVVAYKKWLDAAKQAEKVFMKLGSGLDSVNSKTRTVKKGIL
jgi:hypothetical protein